MTLPGNWEYTREGRRTYLRCISRNEFIDLLTLILFYFYYLK